MAVKQKSNKGFYPVYAVAGKDEPLVNIECQKLVNELVPDEQRATGLLKAEADKISASDVLDELRTLPFLAAKRVVVLTRAEKFISENRDILEHYLDCPVSTGILVLTVGNLDSRTRFAKKLSKIGKLISVSAPSGRELPGRLKDYALDAYAKQITPDAVIRLIEMLGEQLPQLYSEIDKLSIFAADKKKITVEDVDALTGHNRLYNLFDVINSIIINDTANALYQLRLVFSQDKSAQYTFVGALAYHLRRMFSAKALLQQGLSQWEVGKQLRIWYGKDAFFAGLRKVSLDKIGSMISALARVDYQTKTGQKNIAAAAEELILRLSAV